jgi:ABC-2 type transport system ATP-binding protein
MTAVLPAPTHAAVAGPGVELQAPAPPPALMTHELTRRFGDLLAVDHIDLEVGQAEIFGLLGSNGAGKSSTIRMLTTLLVPTSGTATVSGHDVIREPAAVRRSIGYVPQLLSADGTLTGYENLLISARLHHLPRAFQRQRIPEALASVGLTDARDRLVRTYSGGMIRRLELAAAMLHQPLVLFLDEPTVGLDPVARFAIWEHLRRLRAAQGTTILLTTHHMDEAQELCDRIAIMEHGRIAVVGRPRALREAQGPDATLDEVFAAHAGHDIDTGGSWRDVGRTRRTAQRVG